MVPVYFDHKPTTYRGTAEQLAKERGAAKAHDLSRSRFAVRTRAHGSWASGKSEPKLRKQPTLRSGRSDLDDSVLAQEGMRQLEEVDAS